MTTRSEDHSFTTEDVDAAVNYVITQGAENRAATVYYTLVFGAAGLPSPQGLHQGGESHLLTQFMKAFHDRCAERRLPPLDSLVVHVAGGREGWPGVGYFRVNSQPDPLGERVTPEQITAATVFWRGEQQRCREWGVLSRRRGT